MYELNGKQYNQEQVAAAAAKTGLDVNTYIQKVGLTFVQSPIVETTGKELSQGQGAPAAENVAPENQMPSTESPLEDGSLDSQEISKEEKMALPFNIRNQISSTDGDFSAKNVAKVIQEFKENEEKPISERLFGGEWAESFANLGKRYVGTDGIGGAPGSVPISIAAKLKTAVDQFYLGIKEADKVFEQEFLFKNESEKNRLKAAGLSDERIQEQKENLKKDYKDLIKVQKAVEALPVITVTDEKAGESFMNNIAALIGSGATVADSVVPAIIAGTAGTIVGGPAVGTAASIMTSNSMMAADFVTSYNITKAKEKNPGLTEEEALEKLVQDGDSEFLKPMAAAVPAMALEAVGIKGISKWIQSQRGLTKSLGGLMWAANGEGLTESFQSPIEEYNQLMAKGEDPIEALPKIAQHFKDNFTQTYIEAFAGTLVFSGLGKGLNLGARKSIRAVSSLRAEIDENQIEQKIDQLGDLNLKKINAKSKQAKEAIQLKIEDTEAELEGLIVKAASIIDFASEKDLNEISNLEDLKISYINKVKEINKSKESMPTEEYLETLEVYKQKFLDAKNRINGISNKVKEEHQKQYNNLQELYNKYEGNTNKLVSETLTKDDAGNNVNEQVENSTFGKQVGKLAESITKRLFDPITPDARNGVTRLEYKRTVISNAAVQLSKFNPEKGKTLDQYMSFTMNARANSLAGELGIESTQEQGGMGIAQDVTAVKDAMSTETADATIDIREEQDAIPEQKKIAEKLNMGPANLMVFKQAAKKVLGGKLPSVENKKELKKALDDAFRTSLTTAIKNISGTRKAYQQFLQDNWKTLYDAIPQDVINKRFSEFNRAVIDPKTGKQKRLTMAEGTAAGELVFEKRTDVTKEEFLNYMNAKGSTKAARKNALSEMLATQIGFDEIVDALADPEINKRFKEIQEIQGFTVPENFEKQVAIIINRLDQFIAKINKIQQESLKAGFIVPELSLQAIKTFAIVLKNGLKAGMSIAKAIQQAIKQASEYGIDDVHKKSIVETFNSFEDIVTVVSEDPNFKKLKSKLDKNSNAAIQRHLQILEDKLKNDIKNATSEDQKLDLIYDYLNNSLAVAKDTTSWKGVTSNEGLISYVEKLKLIPNIKPYFTVSNKALAFNGKPITSYNNTTADVRYVRPKTINKTLKTLAKKGFNNILEVFDKRNIITQQHEFSNDLISKVAKNIVALESSLGKEFAISYLKIQQLGGESDLRLVGKIRSIQKNVEGDYTYEHTPPIEELIQSIAYTIKNSKNLESDVKDILNKSFVDVVSKTDADILNSTGKKIETAEKFDILNGDSIVRYEGVIDKKDLHFFNKKYNEKQTPEQKENNSIDEALKSSFEQTAPKVAEQEAKSMSRTFNEMLERKKGISANDIISKTTATLSGKGKGKFKLFVPPGAEDFEGFLYAFAGAGKRGEADLKFFKEKLLDPIAKANYNLNFERQGLKAKYSNLIKNNKGVIKKLRKESDYQFYSNDAAVRVWMWDKLGYTIPNLNASDIKNLTDAVNNDPALLKFANELINTPNKKESWQKPDENWAASTIEMDYQEILSKIGRARIFSEFIENVDVVFSKDNLNKVEAAYGSEFRNNLEDIIYRIKKGKSREFGTNGTANKFLNWVRGAVNTTMFFNMRSALLQQLSIVNFTNFSDNNPIAQAKVISNPKEYGQAWAEIFNSDWMKERRQGLKTDINEAELIQILEKSKDGFASILRHTLQKGFILTKYGDNIAIATGGAPFLINRTKKYIKEGLNETQAKEKAFLDFQEIAEKTQQSSRQDLLSNQQVSVVGRLFLAFQNTPMQYARLTKKAALDLINRRGDDKTNIAKIVYYGAVQNMVFSYLQNALFASIFSDDEEDEKIIDSKTERAINNTIDGFLRGTGIAGGIIATLKNAAIRYAKENDKGWKGDKAYVMLELLNVAPPVGIKARKLYGAMKSYDINKKIVDNIGYDNPAHPYYGIAGSATSAAFNVPLDRVVTKMTNLKEAMNSENEAWQRTALFLGYNTWDLGIKDAEIEAARKAARKKGVKVPKSKFSPSFKKFGKKFN